MAQEQVQHSHTGFVRLTKLIQQRKTNLDTNYSLYGSQCLSSSLSLVQTNWLCSIISLSAINLLYCNVL